MAGVFSISERAILIIQKFFDEEIGKGDYEDFPFLDKTNNNLTCSLVSADSKTYNGIPSATMKTDLVVQLQKKFKELVKQKGARFNKPEVCFFAYVLQQIKINNGDTVYSKVVNNLQINLDLPEEPLKTKIKNLCIAIIPPICLGNHADFTRALSENSVKFPENEASEKLNTIKNILTNEYNNIKWDEIKIVDMFYIYDSMYKKQNPSIIPIIQDTLKKTEYQIIINNLYNYLTDLKLIVNKTENVNVNKNKNVTSAGIEKIVKVFTDLNPERCHILKHDLPDEEYDYERPDKNMSTLFKDYTLDKLGEFMNLKELSILIIEAS